MMQRFANLSPSCQRGQPEGLITDLPGLYIHASTSPPPTAPVKDGLLASQGSSHASLKLIRMQLDGRYLLHGACVRACRVFCLRVHAPQGLRSQQAPGLVTPLPPPLSIHQPCSGSCEGVRRRKESQDGCHFFLLDVSPL